MGHTHSVGASALKNQQNVARFINSMCYDFEN